MSLPEGLAVASGVQPRLPGLAMALAAGWPPEADLRSDVEVLAAIDRPSASPGEHRSAQWAAARLEAAGAAEVEVETFRYHPQHATVHALHAGLGLAALRIGRRNGPAGAAAALALLASLEGEVSGRGQWLREALPKRDAHNAVGRLPAHGERARTLVLVAHHDAAHTGLIWHPRVVKAGAARNLRRRSIAPYHAAPGAALAAGAVAALARRRRPRAARALRAGAAAVLGATVALTLDVALRPAVPGASDNASGVAGLLALVELLAAERPAGLEVLAVVPGCEEVGMGGMRAFLAAHGGDLDPARTLVLGLDTLGAGTPMVLEAEGSLLRHRYRERELALARAGAGRAGCDPPPRWRIGGWTDPVLALHAGLPALSLLSMGPGYFPNYHHPTDTPDRVDYACVRACVRLAAGIVAAWSEEVDRPSGPK